MIVVIIFSKAGDRYFLGGSSVYAVYSLESATRFESQTDAIEYVEKHKNLLLEMYGYDTEASKKYFRYDLGKVNGVQVDIL